MDHLAERSPPASETGYSMPAFFSANSAQDREVIIGEGFAGRAVIEKTFVIENTVPGVDERRALYEDYVDSCREEAPIPFQELTFRCQLIRKKRTGGARGTREAVVIKNEVKASYHLSAPKLIRVATAIHLVVCYRSTLGYGGGVGGNLSYVYIGEAVADSTTVRPLVAERITDRGEGGEVLSAIATAEQYLGTLGLDIIDTDGGDGFAEMGTVEKTLRLWNADHTIRVCNMGTTPTVREPRYDLVRHTAWMLNARHVFTSAEEIVKTLGLGDRTRLLDVTDAVWASTTQRRAATMASGLMSTFTPEEHNARILAPLLFKAHAEMDPGTFPRRTAMFLIHALLTGLVIREQRDTTLVAVEDGNAGVN